jgi:hypothetical protein
LGRSLIWVVDSNDLDHIDEVRNNSHYLLKLNYSMMSLYLFIRTSKIPRVPSNRMIVQTAFNSVRLRRAPSTVKEVSRSLVGKCMKDSIAHLKFVNRFVSHETAFGMFCCSVQGASLARFGADYMSQWTSNNQY